MEGVTGGEEGGVRVQDPGGIETIVRMMTGKVRRAVGEEDKTGEVKEMGGDTNNMIDA